MYRFMESLYFCISLSFASVAMANIVVNTVIGKTVHAECTGDSNSRRKPSRAACLENGLEESRLDATFGAATRSTIPLAGDGIMSPKLGSLHHYRVIYNKTIHGHVGNR
jgi:hypothetical protein